MRDFNSIVLKIIKEQELVMGPLAWSEAEKVEGLNIVDKNNGEIIISTDNQMQVVNNLVLQYQKLFGYASHEVSKSAVAGIIADWPIAEIPSSLAS